MAIHLTLSLKEVIADGTVNNTFPVFLHKHVPTTVESSAQLDLLMHFVTI